ncbi:MAG: putative quinol monooxygenase [Candidatus Berkiellales bacterium]
MVKAGLYVRILVKPGREQEAEKFLRDARSFVLDEPQTTAWFSFKIEEQSKSGGPTAYGIFDVFPDDSGRQAHLSGGLAKKLMSCDFLHGPLEVHQLNLLANKL